MSKGRILLIVLISVVAVAALVAGGYMLFRWGYARGAALQGAAPEAVIVGSGDLQAGCAQFIGEPGDLLGPAFGRGFMNWGMHGGYGMPHMSWFGFSPFGWIGGLFGLLLGGGVLALAVYGVIALLRRNPTNQAEVEKKLRK